MSTPASAHAEPAQDVNKASTTPLTSTDPVHLTNEIAKETETSESPTPSSSTAPDSSTAAGENAEEALEKPTSTATEPAIAWQAIYSPQYNTYYFYNTETQETTWNNPLQPSPATASSPAVGTPALNPVAEQGSSTLPPSEYTPLEAAAIAQGIDPGLAHLDPTLAGPSSSSLANPSNLSFTAKFNKHTGRFTAMDGRTPDHLSEYERAKRMSEVFFDVGAWEKDLAARDADDGSGGGEGGASEKKRKRPTKKDLVSVLTP